MSVSTFDPADPAFLSDPLPVYRRMRDETPVLDSPIAGGICLVSRYEDVRQLLRLPNGLMQPPGEDAGAPLGEGAARRIYRNLMVLNDPPKHTRLRRLTQKALTPAALEHLREDIAAVVDLALDGAARRGGMDAVAELAFAVPYQVICGMLGIAADRRRELLHWTPDFFRIFLPAANDGAGIAACNAACQFFIDYIAAQIEQRRKAPGDDIFSALVAAEEEGEQLDADELVATVLSLLAGGFDTTMGMIAAGVYLFASQPEQFARLRQDPVALARAAADEVVRWESPVAVSFRYFAEPFTLHGIEIPAGRAVWMPLLSANHDERRFEQPERIDIDRANKEHVAFGGSRHLCIGQHLAKLESELSFARLAQRFRRIELAGPAPRRQNFQFRSFEALPVRLIPA